MKKLSFLSLNLVIFVLLVFTIVIGHNFTDEFALVSVLWPAIGLVIGWYFLYGKRSVIGIILGLLLGNFINQFFLANNQFVTAFSYSLIFSSVSFLEAFIFKCIMDKFKVENIFVKQNFIFYVLTINIVVLFGGVLKGAAFVYINDSIKFLDVLTRSLIGDFTGVFVFGSLIILNYTYDKTDFSKEKIINNGLYIFGFVILLIFMFLGLIPGFTFTNFDIILVIFFVFAALTLSYRMILLLNYIYIIAFQFFYLENIEITSIRRIIYEINLFLIVMSLVSVLIKYFLDSYLKKDMELTDTTLKLDDLMESIFSLFQMGDKLYEENISINKEYLLKVFDISVNVFRDFDRASCYIIADSHVRYLKGINIDIDELNTLNFDEKDFLWNKKKVFWVKNSENQLKKELDDDYEKFLSKFPKPKETVYLSIQISKGMKAGISFDIYDSSEKQFSYKVIEQYQSFQNVMNNFYTQELLVQRTIDLKQDLVLSLIRTLELYDKFTSGHSEQVAKLALKIGEMMKLDKHQLFNLYWSGIVHDIGKIGVDYQIVNKPTRLNQEEYEKMKKHVDYGYQVLSKSKDLEEIAKLVKHHHEWWDGGGYPDGLKGKEIPLCSQILAVADAISTMATSRPYKIVKTADEIINELRKYSGTQFSPIPTKYFIEFLKSGDLKDIIPGL
jgi:HD-GYP domain-containing protein (c-di-GMP phosphodiesterase class II)/integral membrane sensor domain MASE1